MARTISDASANAMLDAYETAAGTAVLFRTYNGTMPANASAALAGNTLLSQGTLPSDWLTTAAARSKSKVGTWTITGQAAASTGTAQTFYRIFDSTGTTCHEQGTVGVNVPLSTSALTAANGNVLTFAATSGVVLGMNVSGAGIVAGTTVVAVTATTVTLSQTSTAGVASAAAITFSYDAQVDNATISQNQVMTVNAYTLSK